MKAPYLIRFTMNEKDVMRMFVKYEQQMYYDERDAAENHDQATQWESADDGMDYNQS